jgi:hypothetical protein
VSALRQGEYVVRAWVRVLEAAEQLASQNQDGKLAPGDVARLTFMTPYTNPQTLHGIMQRLRDGDLDGFDPKLAERARAIACGQRGYLAVNRPIAKKLLALGWKVRAIHQEINAERARRGMAPSSLRSIYVTVAKLKGEIRDRQRRV